MEQSLKKAQDTAAESQVDSEVLRDQNEFLEGEKSRLQNKVIAEQ